MSGIRGWTAVVYGSSIFLLISAALGYGKGLASFRTSRRTATLLVALPPPVLLVTGYAYPERWDAAMIAPTVFASIPALAMLQLARLTEPSALDPDVAEAGSMLLYPPCVPAGCCSSG